MGGALQGAGASMSQGDSEDDSPDQLAEIFWGSVLMLTALFIGSQKWALIQFLMHRSEPQSTMARLTKSKPHMVRIMAPITGLTCALVSLQAEPDAWSGEHLSAKLMLQAVGIAC